MNEIIKINGSLVSLSESEDKTCLEGKFLICPLDVANANGVGLKENDLTDDEKAGLTNQPVVCKVIKNNKGEYDFTGHNMKISFIKDADGKKIKKYEFDTSPIGFHTSATVEEIEIDGEKKNCIVARAKIWKRYDKAISALNRILELKKEIKTSWEISYANSYEENGVKWLKDIIWLGNCVLGEFVTPAYKDAGMLEVAEENDEIQLVMAFTEDLVNEEAKKEVSQIDEESILDIDININEGGNKDMHKEGQSAIENSSLTDNDLYTKVRRAINSTDNSKWYYISVLYPLEYRAVAYTWDRDKDEDFVEFSYSVNSDETISINSQKDVKMVFVEKTQIDNQISEINNNLTNTEKELAEAGKAIAELTTEKENLTIQISELEPYKEKVLEMEKAELERQLAEKKECLKKFALEDNLIEESELETDEKLSTIFAELTLENLENSQEKIELIKGRKALHKFKENKEVSQKEIETSETKSKSQEVKTDLNNGEENVMLSALDIVKSYLKK